MNSCEENIRRAWGMLRILDRIIELQPAFSCCICLPPLPLPYFVVSMKWEALEDKGNKPHHQREYKFCPWNGHSPSDSICIASHTTIRPMPNSHSSFFPFFHPSATIPTLFSP